MTSRHTLLAPVAASDHTDQQRREHYVIEKELAQRLRIASPDERRYLYTQIYDELFRRVPHHPQLIHKQSPQIIHKTVAEQLHILQPYLSPSSTVLEIGCGDCTLARALAPQVRALYAIDVSPVIMHQSEPLPDNVVRIVSDGCTLPLRAETITIAVSNQLIEHLHPDDAEAQLHALYRVLTPGGRYICMTPNRLSGPYDISRYFDRVATGLHLKEYTAFELADLFTAAGFSRLRLIIGASRNIRFHLPVAPVRLLERFLLQLPQGITLPLARRMPLGDRKSVV